VAGLGSLEPLEWAVIGDDMTAHQDRLNIVVPELEGFVTEVTAGTIQVLANRTDLDTLAKIGDTLIIEDDRYQGRWTVTDVSSSDVLQAEWFGSSLTAPTGAGAGAFREGFLYRGPYVAWPSGFIDMKGDIHVFWFESNQLGTSLAPGEEAWLCYRRGRLKEHDLVLPVSGLERAPDWVFQRHTLADPKVIGKLVIDDPQGLGG